MPTIQYLSCSLSARPKRREWKLQLSKSILRTGGLFLDLYSESNLYERNEWVIVQVRKFARQHSHKTVFITTKLEGYLIKIFT